MINDVSSALTAYQQALGRISGLPQMDKADKSESQPKETFGDMVKTAVEEATSTVKQAETLSMLGIAGKADVQDVVMAISNAEHTLETVVAFRDSAIKAYREIIQMTI